MSAIFRWIKLYSEVKVDDDTILTAKQIRELQKRWTAVNKVDRGPK